MSKTMLIDACHAEETRVVVVDGNKIDDFDFESRAKKQLRGNIYLAKVVRVEPSLQAAFVEYGGDRHGFLAFNEIHPDYYQIPQADREALAREEAEAEAARAREPKKSRGGRRGRKSAPAAAAPAESLSADETLTAEDAAEIGDAVAIEGDEADLADQVIEIDEVVEAVDVSADEAADDLGDADEPAAAASDAADDMDEDDQDEALERRKQRLMRRYKIQDVIRRRQIMLVQVVKEERGNKGAALTSYLSLAGRYGVLMPNTARGGGISRKITSATDRKRLKSAVADLEVPNGMGLIVRTAGAKRTKAELRRDYEYLMRLWGNIRDTTLNSVAPALIYAEEDLVKRAIRDLFDKDIGDVWVEGEAGYREARDFMRMIMPSMAKSVQPYREPVPLFVKHKVEDQLSQIYSPVAPLKSGGYLVINQTEALVSIDVNSGRATKERTIEHTALKTNLEAAEEAARQLRLRDLAGLIVIDFIDMDEGKHNRAVEKRLKDCLKEDRARVQMGRISAFGLMEISRQRRRTGVLEGTTHVCPHCQGVGRVRNVESSALSALREAGLEAARGGKGAIALRVAKEVGLYLLNEKRQELTRLHQRQGLYVKVELDDQVGDGEVEIDRLADTYGGPAPAWDEATSLVEPEDDWSAPELDDEDEDEDDEDMAVDLDREDEDDDEPRQRLEQRARPETREDDAEGRRGRRRRRRRGGRRDEEVAAAEPAAAQPGESLARRPDADVAREQEDEYGRRRRRRGRRGGRRMRDDERPTDVYAWSRPNLAEDFYGWAEPVQPLESGSGQPFAEDEADGLDADVLDTDGRDTDALAPAAMSAEAEAGVYSWSYTPAPAPEEPAAASPAPAANDAGEAEAQIWVELPEAEPVKPAKPRRSRSRRKPAAEAAAEAAPIEAGAGEAGAGETVAAEPVAAEAAPAAVTQADTPAEVVEALTAATDLVDAEPVADTLPEAAAVLAEAEQGQVAVAGGDAAEVAAEQPQPAADLPALAEAEPAEAMAPQAAVEAAEPEGAAPAATDAPQSEPAPAVRLVDPLEVTMPPAKPKRGWWRRSG